MIFLMLLTFCLVGRMETLNANIWDVALRNGVFHLMRTGDKSLLLHEALRGLEFPQMFRPSSSTRQQVSEPIFCKVCNIIVGVILSSLKWGFDPHQMGSVVIKLCDWLKLENSEVCEGYVHHNIETFIYVYNNRPNLTASQVCATVFQNEKCKDPNANVWKLDIPDYLPNRPNVSLTGTLDGSFKVAHITDIHYDPNYSVGSDAECSFRICCQNGTVPKTNSSAAGHWSDYRKCNAPWYAVVDLFEQIKKEHNISYVYFTGDIINQKTYDTTKDRNIADITKIYVQMKETFGDTPVYPILGNHESHPVNLFSPDDVSYDLETSTHWVYTLAADLWEPWLPTDTRETILKGGYYTVLVRPGFRIIALNSNVCYTYNFWLLYNDHDPFEQLQWLIDTLLDAESNNEKVHILSHVPSGDSFCFLNWGREYTKIVNRFSHIISAQFNGHTHFDETLIYYSNTNRSQAINVAFNGGSFSTYLDVNPNYKIYDVDAGGMDVTNFESWMYSITAANENPASPPTWYKLYDFKSAYNLSSLHPQELSDLVERMTEDRTLTQSYFRYKYRDAEPMIAKGCDMKCELENICLMVTSYFGDDYHCKLYTKLYHRNRLQQFINSIFG